MAVEVLERQRRFDRLLPQLVEAFSSDADSELADLMPAEAHALSPLFEQLHDDIWNQLPTVELTNAETKDAMARVTADCDRFLKERQSEIQEFVRSLCHHVVRVRVHGVVHPDAMAKALEKARRPLLVAVDQIIVPLEPILTADLIVQPLAVIQEEVRNWLQVSSRAITNQLVLSLHTLVQMDVVGIIEWPGPRACKLHFFRHIVDQDRVRTRSSSKVQRVARNTLSIEEWERVQARNRFGIERHEHHVMNAEARELRQTRYPIPLEHKELIDRIPEWLRPHVRVLEGDLILERVVQRTLSEEQWESTPKLRTAYEIEPAILLGHCVLTGWGQREVDRETHRRQRELVSEIKPDDRVGDPDRRIEVVRDSTKWQSVANAAAVAAVIMMLFSRLQQRVMLPLSLLLDVVALVAMYQSLQARFRGSSHSGALIYSACRIIATAFGLLAIQSALFGVLYGSWSMFGLSLPLALVAFVTGSMAASRESS